jgi:transcriptional regulator with PAS, ATPase and Fis domain
VETKALTLEDQVDLPAELTLQELEKLYILQTLVRMGQNRTRTAAKLGISLRSLQYKLKAYRQEGLNPQDGVNSQTLFAPALKNQHG